MDSGKMGYVYVMRSDSISHLKIGGSDFPPSKRLAEINASEPYRGYGPWHLADFREVEDWRVVERDLHFKLAASRSTSHPGTKELFEIPLQKASEMFEQIDEKAITKRPVIDRMFNDSEFYDYLVSIFAVAGLGNWIDGQGIWTLVLFPKTMGGRYFTMNIGSHEVAFTTLRRNGALPFHAIYMDKLVLENPAIEKWLGRHSGQVLPDAYDLALPDGVSIGFDGEFQDAREFLELEGVRRAILAYWTEAMVNLKQKGKFSTYMRYHNWNAVAEIRRRGGI